MKNERFSHVQNLEHLLRCPEEVGIKKKVISCAKEIIWKRDKVNVYTEIDLWFYTERDEYGIAHNVVEFKSSLREVNRGKALNQLAKAEEWVKFLFDEKSHKYIVWKNGNRYDTEKI